jgi:hypothetical protein
LKWRAILSFRARPSASLVIPGAIVTVAIGGKDAGGQADQRRDPLPVQEISVLKLSAVPVSLRGADDAYPTSPLMKGRPIQMLATDAANRLLDSAMLKNAPPVGYDRSDACICQKRGGPVIEPFASGPRSDNDQGPFRGSAAIRWRCLDVREGGPVLR